jgi:Ca2+-binding EF-hand superfamily protein
MRTLHVLIAMILMTVAPIASATGPKRAVPQAFSVHDQDRDGYLSPAEYAALSAHCRTRRDAKGWPLCNATRLLAFDDLDHNGDGRIGEDELLETLGRRFRGGRPE